MFLATNYGDGLTSSVARESESIFAGQTESRKRVICCTGGTDGIAGSKMIIESDWTRSGDNTDVVDESVAEYALGTDLG